MTNEVISDDFSSDTSGDYDGVAVSVAAGVMSLDAAGMAIHQTEITGNQIWMWFETSGAINYSNEGVAISDASGNGFILLFALQTTNLEIYYFTEYDTYTTYVGNDDPRSDDLGTASATNRIGIGWDLDTQEVHVWNGVTADNPTYVGGTWEWDGAAADQTIDYGTLGQTQDGNYLGFGSWGSTTTDWDAWAAGNFAGGGPVADLIANGVIANP